MRQSASCRVLQQRSDAAQQLAQLLAAPDGNAKPAVERRLREVPDQDPARFEARKDLRGLDTVRGAYEHEVPRRRRDLEIEALQLLSEPLPIRHYLVNQVVAVGAVGYGCCRG